MELRHDWSHDYDDASDDRNKSSRTNKYTENWEDRFGCKSKIATANREEEDDSTLESGIWLGIIGINDEGEPFNGSQEPVLDEKFQLGQKFSNVAKQNNQQLPAFKVVPNEISLVGGKNSPPISFLTRNTTGRDQHHFAMVTNHLKNTRASSNQLPIDSVVDCSSKSPMRHMMTTDTLHQQTKVFDSRGNSQEKPRQVWSIDKSSILRTFQGLRSTEHSSSKVWDAKGPTLQQKAKPKHRLGARPLLNLKDAKKLATLAAPVRGITTNNGILDSRNSKSLERCAMDSMLEQNKSFLRKSFAEEVGDEPEVQHTLKQGSGLQLSYLRASLRANLPPSINISKLSGGSLVKKDVSMMKSSLEVGKTKSPDLKAKLKQLFAFEQTRLTLDVPQIELCPTKPRALSRSKSRKPTSSQNKHSKQ